MFKKAVEVKSQQRLSGADRKKLKRTLKDRFPNASDIQFDSLIPPKAEITVSKYPNRVLVYSIEGGCPMFFDIDGRGTQLFPTVYALWEVPDLVPAFWLKGGEVSHFVLGGADLMFPGIYIPPEGYPSFTAGEIWSVKVPGNPAPIAIGTTTMNINSDAMKPGLHGKALRINHYYRDTLWSSMENPYVPNAGFYEDAVFEDPSLISTDSNENEPSIDQENETVNSSTMENSAINQITDDLNETNLEENITQIEDQNTLSVEDIDSLLDKCLLQALYTTIKDKDLPMPGSTLWSSHVLPCRPSGITIDVKKSSHKKLSKWLQAKASTKLITVKEDKHKKETSLVSVNRNHPDYLSFKPEKKKIEKDVQITDDVSNITQTNKMLEVTEIYKSSVHVNPIFNNIGADINKLYSASEASDIVFEYIDKHNLVKPTHKAVVILDAILCDALYKGAIKKGTMYPSEIHKKEVGPTFISRMQAYHRVTRGNDSVVRKGGLKTIQIMTERRQGNKKMTKLSGVELFLIDPEGLASELQKKFACSTTLAELPGKKGLEVLVQGGVIDDLAKHLVEQFGIPKKYIEVYDKTKR